VFSACAFHKGASHAAREHAAAPAYTYRFGGRETGTADRIGSSRGTGSERFGTARQAPPDRGCVGKLRPSRQTDHGRESIGAGPLAERTPVGGRGRPAEPSYPRHRECAGCWRGSAHREGFASTDLGAVLAAGQGGDG